MKREDQGSTFFNEGVAFPHVRMQGLAAPGRPGIDERGTST